jgi:hypothetical protein
VGKQSKQRHCPALRREIGAAECGSKRQSEIDCPEACQFNPFAPVNYDQFLDIERRALESMTRRGGLLSARTKGGQDWPGERNDEEGRIKKVSDVLTATGYARQHDMASAMDASWTVVEYDLAADAERCVSALVAIEGAHLSGKPVAPDVQVVFLEPLESSTKAAPGRAVIGQASVSDGRLELRASHDSRAARLREMVEFALSGLVKFKRESREDLGARIRSSLPSFDPSQVVPALRGEPEKAVTFESLAEGPTAQATPEEAAAHAMRQAVRRWIDEPVPMLEGMSPRAAAKVPRLRPALLHLVKGEIRMHDQRNLEGGFSEDINWLASDYGLAGRARPGYYRDCGRNRRRRPQGG